MSVFTNSVRRIRNASRHAGYRALNAHQNRDYYLNSHALKQSALPKPNYANIRRNFEALGLTVIPYKIDLD